MTGESYVKSAHFQYSSANRFIGFALYLPAYVVEPTIPTYNPSGISTSSDTQKADVGTIQKYIKEKNALLAKEKLGKQPRDEEPSQMMVNVIPLSMVIPIVQRKDNANE